MDKQAFDLLMKRFDRVDQDNAEIKKAAQDSTTRISTLEKKDAHRTGIMVGGGAVITFFSGLVSWFFKG